MKLPLQEREHSALRRALAPYAGLVSSALLRVEAERACARYGPLFAERARDALAGVALLPLDDAILASAATLTPPELRTLDAIHLATALSLGDDLGAVFAYDGRLAVSAISAGVPTEAPA